MADWFYLAVLDFKLFIIKRLIITEYPKENPNTQSALKILKKYSIANITCTTMRLIN